MNLEFDNKGFLKPYSKIEITLNQLEDFFVNSSTFNETNTRLPIFNNYRIFLTDFQKEITPNFVQWIDGSFVTTKMNPADIDFVTLVDFETYEKHEQLIDSKYRRKAAKTFYGKNIDSYFVKIFPKDHKKHFVGEFDLVYWKNWFSETKKNRFKKKFPKGFLEIKFGEKILVNE